MTLTAILVVCFFVTGLALGVGSVHEKQMQSWKARDLYEAFREDT